MPYRPLVSIGKIIRNLRLELQIYYRPARAVKKVQIKHKDVFKGVLKKPVFSNRAILLHKSSQTHKNPLKHLLVTDKAD